MVHTVARVLVGLLKLVLLVASASALMVAGMGYGCYRLLGGKRPARFQKRLQSARIRVKDTRDDVWLNLKIPGFGQHTCPHCQANLDPQSDPMLCPECYGDLKQTCPGCGEAVSIQRRICPYCQGKLQRQRERH